MTEENSVQCHAALKSLTTPRRVALILGLAFAVVPLAGAPGFAIEPICQNHWSDPNPATHDPAIEQRVEKLALQLLAGDPDFMRQWSAYVLQMHKGPAAPPNAADLPNAAQSVADASIDLHCFAPVEARLEKLPDGQAHLDVDDWRSHVNASVYQLGTHKWTAQQAQDELNKVRSEDRGVAAADFSRDCALSSLHFAARTKPDGTIEVSAANH